MPRPSFELLRGALNETMARPGYGKVTTAMIVTLWAASSGMEAIIEGLNVAYAVKEVRSWWQRRLVAIALTISLGTMIDLAVLLHIAGTAVARGIGSYFPILERAGRLSKQAQWIIAMLFLLLALALIFRFAPNLRQRRLEAILPGAVLSLVCWLGASAAFKFYLSGFGAFDRTYRSLGAVIVLLVWLYVSGAAILVGGELNSVIWEAVLQKQNLVTVPSTGRR